MSDAGLAQAFAALQRLYLVIDPASGEERWQRAHDFDALPAESRTSGRWYKVGEGGGLIRVDENLNGQWFKQPPADLDLLSAVEVPRVEAPSLLAAMQSVVDRLPAEPTTPREHLAGLLANLSRLAAPDHALALARELRQTAFATLLGGRDLLLEYLAKAAGPDLRDGLANGRLTGRDAGALVLIHALVREIIARVSPPGATPDAEGPPSSGDVSRVLGMLGAPGPLSLESMAGQLVRDCLAHDLSGPALAALDRLRREASEAVESAREGFYPLGHPEWMLDLYYFGLFLAAPLLHATMVGYEVAGAQPGLPEREQKRYGTLANAAEEKLVRIGDALLFSIRDLGGREGRLKREEIQELLAAGDEDRAQGLVMRLVDLQLFYPQPFRSVLLGHGTVE